MLLALKLHMDKDTLVEKIMLAIEKLERMKGEFSLIMLIPTDPANIIDSKLTLLISAQWLDKMNQKDAYELVVNCLRGYLNNTEFPYMARVTFINSSDKFVKAINSIFKVKRGVVNLENVNISGIQIDRAYLLESKKIDDSKILVA